MFVLFDLDGTLVDSAPDLHAALAILCRDEGRPSPSYATTRRAVSLGSRALLASALAPLPEDTAAYEGLRQRFLAAYAATGFERTGWMTGVPDLLTRLADGGHRWGIVTNKPGDLTAAIVRRLVDASVPPPAVVVCGDTLPVRKPDPAPLLHALEKAAERPGRSAYVGDAPPDVEAARRAGLRAFVALWGYPGTDAPPETWGADALLARPCDLLAHLAPDAGGAT